MNRQTQRAAGAGEPPKGEPTKRELERQMQRTRESLAETSRRNQGNRGAGVSVG